MYSYIATIYDIKNIQKPKLIDEIKIDAYNKAEAIDVSHTEAEKLYPTIKRMINIHQITFTDTAMQ